MIAATVLCGCALAIVHLPPFQPRAAPPAALLRVTMFDVGQGEAILLEGPAGSLLVDTGGAPFGSSSFDLGARVLAPALWSRGVHALDALLLTHGDPDHIGGAAVVLDEFLRNKAGLSFTVGRPFTGRDQPSDGRPSTGRLLVSELWEGIVVPTHRPSTELRERAIDAGIAHSVRREGEEIEWGGVRIRVLHPPAPDWERPRVRNDDSVVLELVFGDVAILLTGDIGADVERRIAPMLTPAATRILKVAHHGSRTSTSLDLISAWTPRIALVSAGRGNTFGHPAREVIGRLESVGARIYRTDLHGEIIVETDGQRTRVRTYTRAEP
jgi:competence protein ComEC